MKEPGTKQPHAVGLDAGASSWRTWHWRRSGGVEMQPFLVLSIFIGLFAGLLVVCFHIAIDFVGWYTRGTHAGSGTLATLLSPAAGALVSALLVTYVFRQARGSGVTHTKAALYVSDGYVPFSTVIGKFLACSISIGSGCSLGPEDPALQMGSGVGSLLGRSFRIARNDMRLLAPVGAAAGIAAAFNTPITAVLFVIEEVIGSWNSRVLGSIVLSAVSAVVVSRWFLGNEPLFRVPAFELRHPSEMLVYALMGIAGGILAAFFIKAVEWLRRLLARLPARSRDVQPLIAGLLVGALGLRLPEIMGAGYEAIDSALHSQFPWRLLLLLAAAKIIATLICTGAGIPGGMFAPTLFTGAMIGGGLGGLAQAYSPFPASSTGEYVLVGMGTFFAGVFRAPMTSVFMVFEVTASYVIILPVLVANTLAYMVSQRLQRSPFFEMVAREEGIELPSSEGQRELQPLRVEDAMEAPAIPVLGSGTPAGDALAACATSGASYCLMFSERTDWFIAWRSALEDASRAGQTRPELVRVPRLHPDLSMDAALTAMNSHPCLPVVSRADSHRLLGILTLDGVHRAYNIRPAAPVTRPETG